MSRVLSACRAAWFAAFGGFLLTCAGCSNSGARVEQPDVDPGKVAQRFIDSYDTDGDGTISNDEMKACPVLIKSIRAYDRNSDGAVSLSELNDRITKIYQDKTALYAVSAKVTLDGKPLQGAHVRLVPESAFGESLRPAEGEAGKDGFAMLSMADSDMPQDLRGLVKGMQTGLYRICVEHASRALPEDVRNGDRLGVEITSAKADGSFKVEIE